ncbi:NAD(P)-dependent dehydrogenase (short-subunit alcohol dehydrogenase family) [Sphingopyxis panaciterrae]|uniref:SDR family oxidoreductase n=1 Tax=Sphingopyxis panaciterrae TaxID=363841 RepID=UPI0014222089|nr:SDR family NAD(P)-dependent oxidoreductase [Sphingopyxis panaciterrae]NIJ37710.1 NAD(P)-dependent dehydrogenase (short-subunit alcohol dehydrogenase family) [Sphingopyxis panaciterrae]
MGRLAGYRTVVTGSASGIGRAIVRRYLAEGAKVVAVVRKEADVASLEAEGCIVVVGSVDQYDTAERAVAAAVGSFDGLDAYVANAGLWDFHKRIEKQTPEQIRSAFDEIFGVNLLGAVYGAHAALGALRESRGSVVVTGSNACFLGGGGGVLYTASKFALRGAVMQLAKEFAPLVRVNGVAPGATDTALSGPSSLDQAGMEMNANSDRMEAMNKHMLMGRVSSPDDHASLFVLLASREESAYVTGAMLLSDGGLTISA